MKKWKHSKDLESYNEPEQSFWKSKKTVLILGIGIIFLMIGSLLTFFTSPENEQYQEYNGYSFYLTQTGWITQLNGQQASFEQSPSELQNIPVEPFTLNEQRVYLAFDPADTNELSYEIQRLKAFLFLSGKNAIPACTTEEGCSDIPLITCENPEKSVYLKYGKQERIYKSGNCIILESQGDPTRIMNRFIYKILGVMA